VTGRLPVARRLTRAGWPGGPGRCLPPLVTPLLRLLLLRLLLLRLLLLRLLLLRLLLPR
jgi:hypothetical protein